MTSSAAPAARSLRRRVTGPLVLLVALVALGGLYTAFAPGGKAATPPDQSMLVRVGRQLYLTGCSTCHGLSAQGTNIAPSLIGVGAAAVDFQVSTGRMPLGQEGPQAPRKQVQYSQPQIDQLAAYIQSLGGGPTVPKVDVADGDLALGNALFRTNCASCHNFSGSGGALTYGKWAPQLHAATPTQVQEAMLTGPENMPVFGPTTFTQHEYNSIVKYVTTITESTDPGGNGIGRVGPVPEGLVAWLIGIGGLLFVTLWIGARAT